MLRRAVELGVNFIDTADSYGPFVAEDLIGEALHPYPDDLVIATKAGLTRRARAGWRAGRPARVPAPAVRARACAASASSASTSPAAPHRPEGAARGPGRRAGRAAGRGQDPAHRPLRGAASSSIEAARKIATDRLGAEPATTSPTARAERRARPLRARGHRLHPVVPAGDRRAGRARAARSPRSPREHGATPAQLALAWLLHRSPVMLPIPGTSSVAHLEENVAAAGVALTDEEIGGAHRRRRLRGS